MTFSRRSGHKRKSKLGASFMVSSLSRIHCINCKDINSPIPLNYTQLYWVSELQANRRLNRNHFHKASISCNNHSRRKPSGHTVPCKARTLRHFPHATAPPPLTHDERGCHEHRVCPGGKRTYKMATWRKEAPLGGGGPSRLSLPDPPGFILQRGRPRDPALGIGAIQHCHLTLGRVLDS